MRRLPPGCGTQRIACYLAAESASRLSPNYPLDYRRITLYTVAESPLIPSLDTPSRGGTTTGSDHALSAAHR